MQQKHFLKIISERIEQSGVLKTTRKMLSERFSVSYGEVGGLGKAFLAHFLQEDADKKTVFLTENIEEVKRYFEDWGIEFVVGATGSVAQEGGRATGSPLRGKIILFSFKDIFQKVISHDEYKKKILTLKAGDREDLVRIADFLVDIGYQRVKKPDSNGEFGIKGDILDLFVGEEKIRIEFFGDRIEKIKCIDGVGEPPCGLPNQGDHAGSPLREIQILPVNIPEGDEYMISWFDDYLFVIDGEDNLHSHVLSMFDYEKEAANIDPPASLSEALRAGEIRKLKSIEDFLKKQKVVYLENFAVSEKKGINLRWFESKRYMGNTTELLHDLKKVKEDIWIFSEKAERIKSFLVNNGINIDSKKVVVENKKISEGVSLSRLGLTIFGDKEIFGELKKKKKRKVDFSALTNLKKGEYVVHIDHGIGTFTGFGEIEIDKIKREYIFIEYFGGDSIYVPLDQADKITKYIAVGNTPPHLSSLKTNQWIKIRKKVAENAEKVAKELLETQATRVGEKPFYYIDDAREQRTLEKTFAYKETKDQKKVIEEVLEDLSKRNPMDRIVCGDVGYGKTEVAIRSAARAVVSGGQVAILVPTTILAEQHLETFRERLDQFGFRIESLSRFRSTAEQKKIVDRLGIGGVDIIIGTHRLLSKDIKFKNLYLIVIDEEQRFGVKHKEKLKKLRSGTDILTMTATPIPRTLYLGLGGLKDISLINTPPEGRLPIKTVVIKNDDEVIREAISREVARGGQVYFVHNRVETIRATEARLKKLLPKVTFVIGHGQMGDQKLAHIMNAFAKGEYQVLICSTIIESGLDISTVNTLIVDKATNFGLSQLHQLRGRIGRSAAQAYAYFLYNSQDLKGNAKRRLSAISEKEALGSGYELSLEDLDIRGSGNILGEEQHGSMQMVGVGYYLKMLEEAVERITQSNTASQFDGLKDIKIDLPLSAYILDGFYKKEEDKIRAYQRLAGLEDMEDVELFENELNENEKIPQEYLNLIEIIKLKTKSKKAGIESIIAKDVLGMGEVKIKKLYIKFDHVLSHDEVNKIFAVNRKWYFGNMIARIDLVELGGEWFRKLESMINSLGK
jgi:transcription-repair coupling factor (superfamily II helicase)